MAGLDPADWLCHRPHSAGAPRAHRRSSFAGFFLLSSPQAINAGRFHFAASIPPQRRETSFVMPDKKTMKRVREDRREGKAPSTQAGEFVREEMEHIREDKHGARSAKQAIAIGLSKARRVGVKLPLPEKGTTSKQVRNQARRDLKKGAVSRSKKPSAKRSRATKKALEREPHAAASHRALSRQAHAASRKRSAAERSRAAKKAARTRARINR